jgi:hypothetical protein
MPLLSYSSGEDQNAKRLEAAVRKVIPDRKKSPIELAHLLLPRFLSQIESDFTDLGKVVNKMYTNSQSSHHGKSLQES